ncbi:MAG TPA: nuclear transport factor 2 family protein [Acidimicrobiales bacterium]|nr:nuclear transport factor 2 family protein [Acidimicrobiales bacterium]
MATATHTTLERLADTHEVVDALYRFAAGQDSKDDALFRSAFTGDAVLDFTQPAARFDVDLPPMVGLEEIAGILRTLEPLRTTHTVTNPRVDIDGDTATLRALVEAQHVRDERPDEHLLLKNTYELRLVRDLDRWRIQQMVIRNVWHTGDPAVLFGGS